MTFIVPASALLSACAGDDAGAHAGEGASSGAEGSGGAAGSGGATGWAEAARQCRETPDCVPGIESRLAALSGPTENPRTITDGECIATGVSTGAGSVSGYACSCSLGGEAILERFLEGGSEPHAVAVPNESSFEDGTSGFIDISYRVAVGADVAPSFVGWAQFFDGPQSNGTHSGAVLDPLHGVDDCTVVVAGSTGIGGIESWVDVEALSLIDEGHEYPFEVSPASNAGYFAYGVDLTALGVVPRPGGEYGLRGGGGGFGDAFQIDRVRLPDEMTVNELEGRVEFERAALPLTWSGRGEVPLRIEFWIHALPLDAANPYKIECLVTDDGAFTVPAAILAAAPQGFGVVDFKRRNRLIVPAGSQTLTVNAELNIEYPFALGERCERPEAAAACARYAERYIAALTECGITDRPTAESICPDHETQACHLCPEYYDCAAANTMCDGALYTYNGGCSCP